MNLSIEKDIKILNEIIETGWLISDFEQCTAIDACEDAITALKQYPVLDRIRAEIEDLIQDACNDYQEFQNEIATKILKIIDKYKVESEE